MIHLNLFIPRTHMGKAFHLSLLIVITVIQRSHPLAKNKKRKETIGQASSSIPGPEVIGYSLTQFPEPQNRVVQTPVALKK